MKINTLPVEFVEQLETLVIGNQFALCNNNSNVKSMNEK